MHNKWRLFILGTAGGMPTKRRGCASVCLAKGEALYLLDAGDGCAAQMQRLGLDVHRVAAILISHMHADHIGGLPLLIQVMQLTRRRQPLAVYLPEEGIIGLKAWLTSLYLGAKFLPFALRLLPIKTGMRISLGAGVHFCAWPNQHFAAKMAELPGRCHLRGQSYSFRLSLGLRRIVYSGDVRQLEDVLPLLGRRRKTDLLLQECAHCALDSNWRVFNRRAAALVVLHLHPRLAAEVAKIRRAIQAQYYGKIIVARDGLVLDHRSLK